MPTQTLIATTGYDRLEIGSDGLDSTLTIDQFDPTLGDLISAVFSIDIDVDVEGSILGDTQGGPVQSASVLGSFRFSVDPDNERATGITGTYSVSAYDPSLPISNFNPTTVSLSDSYASPDFVIGDLASMIGTEGFTFNIDSREKLLLDVGTGAEGQEDNIDIFSTATVTIEYTYDSFTDGGVLAGGPVLTGTIGGPDNDILTGTDVTDTLFGGAGNDILDGGLGPDNLQGGTGNDRYYIDHVSDIIMGETGYSVGGGIDTVYAFIDHTLDRNIEILRLQGTDDLNGGGNWAPESLVGNTGANRLDGSGGDDRINGKAGNDLIIGGAGSDTLVGDTGADTFRFDTVSDSRNGMEQRDFINGFDRGADIIDLSSIDANTTESGDQSFMFINDTAFSGTAGELRWFSWGGNNYNLVEADVDGDGSADFQIFVNQTNVMMSSDFLL